MKRNFIYVLCLSLVASLLFGATAPAFAKSERAALIKELSGTVEVVKAGGSRKLVAFRDMTLNRGDHIQTGSNSKVVLVLADSEDEITIEANTSLYISDLTDGDAGKKSKLKVWAGSLWSKVKTLAGAEDEYEVETPTAVMGVRGTSLLVGIDPSTGQATFYIGSGKGEVNNNNGNPIILLPSQQLQVFADQEDPGVVTAFDLDSLLQLAGPSVVEAIIKNKAEIDRENEEFMNRLRAELESGEASEEARQFGITSLDDLNRVAANLDNLVGNIVKTAVDNNVLPKEQVDALIEEANRQLDKKIDLENVKPIELTASEREKIEQQKRAQEQLRERQQQRQEELERKKQEQQALLERLAEQKKKQQEANEKALEEAKRKAEEELMARLSEAERQRFEEQKEKREQEAPQRSTQPTTEEPETPETPQSPQQPQNPQQPEEPSNPKPTVTFETEIYEFEGDSGDEHEGEFGVQGEQGEQGVQEEQGAGYTNLKIRLENFTDAYAIRGIQMHLLVNETVFLPYEASDEDYGLNFSEWGGLFSSSERRYALNTNVDVGEDFVALIEELGYEGYQVGTFNELLVVELNTGAAEEVSDGIFIRIPIYPMYVDEPARIKLLKLIIVKADGTEVTATEMDIINAENGVITAPVSGYGVTYQ